MILRSVPSLAQYSAPGSAALVLVRMAVLPEEEAAQRYDTEAGHFPSTPSSVALTLLAVLPWQCRQCYPNTASTFHLFFFSGSRSFFFAFFA